MDLVIPTMWREKNFTLEALDYYLSLNIINKIVIIDNDVNKRPNSAILESPVISILNYGKNIYVNPAWNKGIENSGDDLICICNDDILIDELVLKIVSVYESLELNNVDLIGVGDTSSSGFSICPFKMDPSKNLGGQKGGKLFGMAMFIRKKNYKPIPNDLKVWFGDDFIVRNSKKVFIVNSNKFKIHQSSTTKSLRNEGVNINKIIKEDTIKWRSKYSLMDFSMS